MFPKYLLKLIRKNRITNREIAQVLGIETSAASRKLSSQRPISFAQVEAICEHLTKVRGIKIDKQKVMSGNG